MQQQLNVSTTDKCNAMFSDIEELNIIDHNKKDPMSRPC